MEKTIESTEPLRKTKTSADGIHLRFSKGDLLSAIQAVQSSVSAKSTLPILANILLEARLGAQGPQLKVEATDLEVGLRCSLKAEVLREGKITLPAKKFGEIIREMPDSQDIELSSADGKKIEVRSGKIRAAIPGLSPEDFPLIPEFPEKKSFSLLKSVLHEMIKKTQFATSTDETRYVLNGIFFVAQGSELKMVATDGRRLAYISRDTDKKNLDAKIIIPSKAIGELSRLLSLAEAASGEEHIEIAPHENQVSFRWKTQGEEFVLVSRIIEGNFPNYEQVIPKAKEIELEMEGAILTQALRRAALFAQDRGGSVRFSLKKGLLKISANTQNVGEEEEELDVNYNGADFDIAFNPQFLLDILKNSAAQKVRLECTTALNPGLVKPDGDERHLCVVMPMRLQ